MNRRKLKESRESLKRYRRRSNKRKRRRPPVRVRPLLLSLRKSSKSPMKANRKLPKRRLQAQRLKVKVQRRRRESQRKRKRRRPRRPVSPDRSLSS